MLYTGNEIRGVPKFLVSLVRLWENANPRDGLIIRVGTGIKVTVEVLPHTGGTYAALPMSPDQFRAVSPSNGPPEGEAADGDVYYDLNTGKIRIRAEGAWWNTAVKVHDT